LHPLVSASNFKVSEGGDLVAGRLPPASVPGAPEPLARFGGQPASLRRRRRRARKGELGSSPAQFSGQNPFILRDGLRLWRAVRSRVIELGRRPPGWLSLDIDLASAAIVVGRPQRAQRRGSGRESDGDAIICRSGQIIQPAR
jgi:hypothetical protein